MPPPPARGYECFPLKTTTATALAFIVGALAGGWLAACGHGVAPSTDSGVSDTDGGEPDSGDATSADAGDSDGGTPDGSVPDAGPDAGPVDAGSSDAGLDRDLDGIPDELEARLAADYLPYLAVHPSDGCKLGGMLYRVRKHPADAGLIHIVYDHLFQTDCGLTGHVGDDEAFAITVNPAKPAPFGITAMKAISHQGTVCQKVTSCGTCNGLTACELGTYDAGTRPVVYSSKDKHGSYVSLAVCNDILSCLDSCVAAPPLAVTLVNAGEPEAHLVENLTTQGFITADAGWTESSLFDFNPWDTGTPFGGAGVIASDLVDPAFDTEPCF